jgi:predicted transposase/invertase (TIGR01784 family)
MYISFQNSENTLKFERQVREITKSRKPMGLEEAILKEVREQGIEQGIERGIEQGIVQGIGQEKQLAILRAYENGIATAMIAKIVDLPLAQVESVIAKYEKGDLTN